MEHRKEFDAPWVAAFFTRFVDKDGDALVDCLGDFCVVFRAEDGAGLGVWIEQGYIPAGEGVSPDQNVEVIYTRPFTEVDSEIRLLCTSWGAPAVLQT